ncbi:MAG TPA: hypothetical protein ENI34_07240 [candidate division WOR-3 bacterium]|uniref:Uncharacterized protein n=1 Tax=candidate division WOR-3 bacterium TaxID=2052148 RepID=A0A9C9EMX4_UNCW3|nr:hypothetical protein [candidate division WOR-3 bacterium]
MEKIIGHILFMLFIFLSFFNCDHKVSDKMVIKFRQVEDHYWNTKQRADSAGIPFPDSVDADSIEVARFKDGFYWVKVYAYDISDNADSESVLVHIDNFAPRVKQTYPSDWFAFVSNKQKTIWFKFSEPMDIVKIPNNKYQISNEFLNSKILIICIKIDDFFEEDIKELNVDFYQRFNITNQMEV